ncbi:DinB family protein [Gracilimonas mengyeensis]|uniref:DinB superfamily protein n=1 Tax=Gracilimonas mengyeensis TaxID=1302730 RepID=A0A521DRH9_9BACT|nr:DinB family protein [Gracilimonas mengyeensis]SMO74307.1 DinB superfamily protein [Gracilimonas mengyeensis]
MNTENLKSTLRTWETGRKLFLEFFDNYSLDQLNKVPDGFNNNLIWNIGHVIVAQQALIYLQSGLDGYLPSQLYKLYKPGTKPAKPVTQEEANELKKLLIDLVNKTTDDLDQGLFKTYKERMTGTGFYLSSLEDAFEFNNYHEGLHLGYMKSIEKFV